jgi:hypothetical protein
MTRQQKILGTGVALYAASFFLPAMTRAVATSPSGWAPGYACAWYAFAVPISGFGVFKYDHLAYFSLLISGWINPVFWMAAPSAFHERHGQFLGIFRIIVVLMIPFCWVFMYQEHLSAREGHFMWLVGMLLILFSGIVGETRIESDRPA